MNMQQFMGWVTRLLDALPWRRAQRPPKPLTQARVTSPPQANRFMVSDEHDLRRQKAETNPLCSTLHEDAPADQEPSTPAQPLLLPAPPETPSAPLLALPSPPALEASDTFPPTEPTGESQPFQADPERRLAFARYLFRRGTFNEGFANEAMPAQYREQAAQEEG